MWKSARHGLTIDFDLVCWFSGEAANKASGEDGGNVPVDNDYYIRNQNPKIFKETFASVSTKASCININISTESYGCTVADALLPYTSGDPVFPIMWLHVSGGKPDYLWTPYTP